MQPHTLLENLGFEQLSDKTEKFMETFEDGNDEDDLNKGYQPG
jgi:hypothetical protein